MYVEDDNDYYNTPNKEKSVQQKRSDSPVLSVLSMKSDKSMKTPVQLNNGDSLFNQSVRKRSDAPVTSVSSMKSDKSMKSPIQLKDGDSPGDQNSRQRSHSPDPSVWSLKSDKSMKTPIQLKDEASLVEFLRAQRRSDSFLPSALSMKSNKSMKTPFQLKSSQHRSHSSAASVWSLKSDKSMKTPIQLKDEPSPIHQSAQKRSDSFVPSVLSIKSDKSMKTPIQLKGSRQRSHSPDPSVWSLKSDKSMKTPIQLKNEASPAHQSAQKRSVSFVPSLLSMKSDKSMKTPIQLKSSRQRSHSPDPSVWSLKSDKSMKTPIQLNGEDSSGNQRDGRTKSNQDTMKVDSFPGRFVYRHNSEKSLDRLQKFKLNRKKEHLYILEGTAKQANPTYLNEIYTELYIIEGGNGEVSNEHEIQRMEKTLNAAVTATTPIKGKDIFRALPGQDKAIRTVLTKGVAGIGKTVSVQKFTLDWAEEKENQDVQLIFPLPFREINLMKEKTLSLSDLLHVFFPETKEMDLSSDKYKMLFIFDGLDECRLPLDFKSNETLRDVTKETSVDVLLTNLIVGNLLPSALIWITSRPAAGDLLPSECVHRVTEVRGFNDPHKEEYFRKRISDQSLANTVISHLKSSRSLYIMCHIPVFCWISATVLEKMLSEAEGGEIPKTLTQMYTHFLMAQVSIRDTKYNEKQNKDEEIILKLSKLAYEQLERGNIIFYEEDLRECGIDVTEASVYSGLCTQIFREEFGLYHGKVFSFVHLSIQEHLAALYVHLSFHNTGKNVLEAHKSKTPVTMLSIHKSAVDKASKCFNGHFDLFLRFLIGLSLESNHSLLKGILTKNTNRALEKEKTIEHLKETAKTTSCSERALVLFHCLNELNDHSFVTEVETSLTSGIINTDTFTPDLWSALVYILMTSNEKFDEFELHKYGRGDMVLFQMLPVIKLSKKIRMNGCEITYRGCTTVSSFLSSLSNVRELDLSQNNLQDTGVEIISVGFKRSRYKEQLMKEWCSNQSGNTDKSMGEMYVSLTAGLQDTDCRLQSLNLKNCGVTETGCGDLSKALSLNPSHLKVLDLSWNDIGDSGVKHLCAALEKVQCALETLKLDKCGLSETCCASLASALSSKTSSLTDLDLSTNDLQDSGVKKLCVGLQSPHCKLQKLRLCDCKVTHDGVARLTEALKSNPSHLKELDLLENNLEDIHTIYVV